MPRIRMCRSNPCPNTICCQEKPQVSLGHFWIGFGPEPHRSPEGVPYPVTKVPWSKTRWNIPKYFLSVAVSYPYIHMVVICCSMWGSTSETHWQPESLGCIQTLMPLKIHQFYWGCLRQGGMFFPLLKYLFKEQQQQTSQATSCGSMTSSSRLSPRCAGQRSSKGICRCTNTLLGFVPAGNQRFTEE